MATKRFEKVLPLIFHPPHDQQRLLQYLIVFPLTIYGIHLAKQTGIPPVPRPHPPFNNLLCLAPTLTLPPIMMLPACFIELVLTYGQRFRSHIS